jgi:hypothetical protein
MTFLERSSCGVDILRQVASVNFDNAAPSLTEPRQMPRLMGIALFLK